MKQLLSKVAGACRQHLVIAVLCVALPMAAFAQTGVVNSTRNPNQIALKHWYKANLTTTFPVGVGPVALEFDGANIWVGNAGDFGSGPGTVSKL